MLMLANVNVDVINGVFDRLLLKCSRFAEPEATTRKKEVLEAIVDVPEFCRRFLAKHPEIGEDFGRASWLHFYKDTIIRKEGEKYVVWIIDK